MYREASRYRDCHDPRRDITACHMHRESVPVQGLSTPGRNVAGCQQHFDQGARPPSASSSIWTPHQSLDCCAHLPLLPPRPLRSDNMLIHQAKAASMCNALCYWQLEIMRPYDWSEVAISSSMLKPAKRVAFEMSFHPCS